MSTTTTTEPTATTETPPAQQPPAEQKPSAPALNMLKVLGYLADEETNPNDATLPEETPAESEPAATTEGTPAGETSSGTEGEVAQEPEVVAEEQPRVKKKAKPSALDQLPSSNKPAEEQTATEQSSADAIESAVERAMKKAQQTVAPTLDETKLPPEDKKRIELAEYAASIDPKYADFAAKERAFIAARNAHINEWIKQNQVAADSQEFSDYLGSQEYRQFIRSAQPNVTPVERETIKERMIEDRALAKAKAEMSKMQAEYERRAKKVELTPVIQQASTEAEAYVLDIEDDAVKAFRENPQAAMEANPIEAPIIAEFSQRARQMTNEYLKIAEEIEVPDANNPIHRELDKFIEERGQQLDALAEKDRTRNGKVLVSPAAYRQMRERRDPALNRYETLNSRDIANLIREVNKTALPMVLKQRRDALAKAGYAKTAPSGQSQPAQKPATAPAKPAATTQTASPKSIASRTPAPTGKPAVQPVPAHLKALGYDKIGKA